MKKMIFPRLIFFIPVLLAAALILWAACGTAPKDYNVVLISLDTTRGDYVDTGAGARAFTPEIKRFARRAVVFERAFCTIPQTLPSHLSIFTSRFPHELGVYSNRERYDGRHKMLQQVFKEKGYATAGVISLGTIDSDTGFAEGFDEFREKLNDKSVFYTPAEKVTSEALQALHKIKKNRFFLFLHYSDPHSPYVPPGTGRTASAAYEPDEKISSVENLRKKTSSSPVSSTGSLFRIEVDGRPEAEFNAHQGAILRKEIALSPGAHEIRFRAESHPEDFNGFVVRRLKFSKNCKVSSMQAIEFSGKYYGGSHLVKGQEGVVKVRCSGKGTVKLFQVIPMLTWKAAKEYYRQEVEYMDRHVGRFLRALEKEKLLKRTIVAILADHGEGLGERDMYFGHVRYLNQQFIRVPLLFYLPGCKPARVEEPVSLVGTAPTILESAGIRDSDFNYGESLLPLVKNGKKHRQTVYSYAFRPTSREDKLSVIHWPYQGIFVKSGEGTLEREFYDLSLSQSSRKLDEFSPQVLLRRSRGDYLKLEQAYNKMNNAFSSPRRGHPLSRFAAKNKSGQEDLEKLKSMGYL